MRFNWGTGVTIAFIAFMSFILYFVISATTKKEYDFDLVAEDYYKQELAYQKEIDVESRTQMLGMPATIKIDNNNLTIQFPDQMDPEIIKGTLFLYRPSDKLLDVEIPISLSDSQLLIPRKSLKDGRWNIKVSWTYNGQEFLTKEEITL